MIHISEIPQQPVRLFPEYRARLLELKGAELEDIRQIYFFRHFGARKDTQSDTRSESRRKLVLVRCA